MHANPDFQRQQHAFTAYIRDPANASVPAGMPPARMALYAEMFYNNFDEHLSLNFPVLRSLYAAGDWQALVRDFMQRHRCTTPIFTEIALEFLGYLRDEHRYEDDDYPFLLELAHYEYVELAVAISTADDQVGEFDPNGNLLAGHPLVAPSTWALSYRFPIHRIGPEYTPSEPPSESTHLVVYRDRDDAVHFLVINAVTQRLIQLVKENPQITGLESLTCIAEELQHPQPDTVMQAGNALLEDLRMRNVILGTTRP